MAGFHLEYHSSSAIFLFGKEKKRKGNLPPTAVRRLLNAPYKHYILWVQGLTRCMHSGKSTGGRAHSLGFYNPVIELTALALTILSNSCPVINNFAL